MTSISTPAKGALFTLLLVSVGLIIAALIVVSLRPGPSLRDADTPIGVVQRYVLAAQSGDLETAQDLSIDGKKQQFCDSFLAESSDSQVVLIRDVTTSWTSRITVSMTYLPEGILPFETYETEDYFELKKLDETWRIETAPWPISLCTAEELGLEP